MCPSASQCRIVTKVNFPSKTIVHVRIPEMFGATSHVHLRCRETETRQKYKNPLNFLHQLQMFCKLVPYYPAHHCWEAEPQELGRHPHLP